MRILHTMLRVGDLERSVQFYTAVMGMRLLARKDYPQGRFTLAFVGYEAEAVEHPLAARGAVLELTHNWDTAAYEPGSGYGHIAIEVQDVYRACEDIAARGGNVVRPAGPMGGGSTVIAFVADPDGYRIELIGAGAAGAA